MPLRVRPPAGYGFHPRTMYTALRGPRARTAPHEPRQRKTGARSSRRMPSSELMPSSLHRASNVAEPPVPSPRLDASDPSTQRIEDHDHRNPDQVNARETNPKASREKAVVGEELLRLETLRNAEQHSHAMDHIEMRDIKRERCTSEGSQRLPDRTREALEVRARDRGGTQCHQDVEQARRIL